MPLQDDNQPPSPHNKRVCLGRVAAPHGVKGLVKILPYGEDARLIEDLGPCYTSEDGGETLTITLKNGLGKYVLASIEGCDDRNRAEELAKTELYVDKGALPAIDDDGSFYIDDLKGLRVMEDDQEIGRIKEAVNYGAGDLLDITLKSGGEVMVPFDDENVPNVDLDGGFVRTTNHKRFIIE